MTATHPVDKLLAALNPVPVHAVRASALDERARTDLAAILAGEPAASPGMGLRPGPSRRSRLALSVAAAVALALVAVVVVANLGLRSGAAYAATPQPLVYLPAATAQDASTLLSEIAARTAVLPDTTGAGMYAYVETLNWDLFTTVNGERVTSEVVSQHRHQWVASDGSGRTVVTARPPGGRTVREDRPASGDPADLMWPLRSLSDDDATLARQLGAGHPASNGPAGRFEAVKDAYLQMPLPPRVRAGMLRYLAATPGVVVTGDVTDRAGRDGIGFSINSDYTGLPTRYTFIIDPDDGRLLGSEDMLTTTAGRLNVPVPSVIGYTVFLTAVYTDIAN